MVAKRGFGSLPCGLAMFGRRGSIAVRHRLGVKFIFDQIVRLRGGGW